MTHPDDAIATRLRRIQRLTRARNFPTTFILDSSVPEWEEAGYRRTGAVLEVVGTELVEVSLPIEE